LKNVFFSFLIAAFISMVSCTSLADNSDQEKILISPQVTSTVLSLAMPSASVSTPSLKSPGICVHKIAFISTGGQGTFEIMVMNSDGTKIGNLSNDPANDLDPAWSPNGMQIAFVSNRMKSPSISLADDYSPTWSPDEKMIAFTSKRRGNAHIFVVTLSTNSAKQVTFSSSAAEDHPAWSPDGKFIAFDSDRDKQGGEIYTLDVKGKDWVKLTNSTQGLMVRQPVWSPGCN
jgi:Tol biopolymer transport system component